MRDEAHGRPARQADAEKRGRERPQQGRGEAGAERRNPFERNKKKKKAKKKKRPREAKTHKTRKMNDLAHEKIFTKHQKKTLDKGTRSV